MIYRAWATIYVLLFVAATTSAGSNHGGGSSHGGGPPNGGGPSNGGGPPNGGGPSNHHRNNPVEKSSAGYNNQQPPPNDDDKIDVAKDADADDPSRNDTISFDIYVTLPYRHQSVGRILEPAVTGFLDYQLPQCRVVEDRKQLQFRPREFEVNIDMVLMDAGASQYASEEDRVWWKYKFEYACTWIDTLEPVDKNTLNQLDGDVKESLRSAELMKEQVLKMWEDHSKTKVPNYFSISLDPPHRLTPSMAPTMAPRAPCDTDDDEDCVLPADPNESPSLPPLPLSESFDSKDWTWRRSSGLVLLLTTVIGTFCLMQMANIRRMQRSAKDEWGNLATEEGVDEILRMGWKVERGKMKVFDKQKVGYREGDSMLIGGYHQSAMVGAEISVATETTQTHTAHDGTDGTDA